MKNNIIQSYIAGLKKGSNEVYNIIYDIYADRLYHFVLLHTKSHDISKDILQETFIKLWEIRETLQEDHSLQSLLFTISKNKIIDHFRSQINKVEFEDYIAYKENSRFAENDVEQDLYYDEFIQVLTICKRLLPERQLELFELSKEQGLSISEIALKLGISEQTVKNQLTTALKTLRKEISKYNILLISYLSIMPFF